jgi:hypothetical protein
MSYVIKVLETLQTEECVCSHAASENCQTPFIPEIFLLHFSIFGPPGSLLLSLYRTTSTHFCTFA